MRGLLITFEGPEGSGKSTQLRLLASRMEAAGVATAITREPGGTRTGDLIRDVLQHNHTGETIHPETETLLFLASRAQLVRSVIVPALEQGICVLCDRFVDSTTAYQGAGRGFGIDPMLGMNAFATGGVTPVVTFLLDVDVREGFGRIARRNKASGVGHDRFEREAISFHERVREGYLELAGRFPERFTVLDAGRDEHHVADDIWRTVDARLRTAGIPAKASA
jgi:dTMP kinase